MYVKKSVRKPQGNKSPGAPSPKDPNVTIIDVEDILAFPPRDQNGVAMVGNFVMKPNATMHTVYMTPSKTKGSFESEGEEDAQSFKHKVEGEHPGNELEIAEFVQNWTGRNCIVILGSCADSYKKVYGSKCAPLQLKPSMIDDNSSRKNILTFEQAAVTGYVPGHYTGSLLYETPATTSESVTFTAANRTQKLEASSSGAAITINDDSSIVHGDVVTLIGGGGSNAFVLSNSATVILKDGADWNALEQSYISLRVVQGASKLYIEEQRG